METKLPPVLETKLAEFRRRVWTVKLAEGILAAVFGNALGYLLVFALDRCMETPAWLRAAILVAGAATLGLGLPFKWHRWVWRQRRLEDAARLLRRTFPRLGDQLLGVVELARADHAAAGRSERLVQAALAQAADAVRDRDFRQAVPDARHRQWACAAGTVLALGAALFLVLNHAARNAFERWATPWRAVDRFTFARVDPLPNKLVVPYAEPFALPVRLSQRTHWSPGEGSARIAAQPEVSARLSAGVYPLRFPPQKADAPLALSVGDIRKRILVQPRERPELTELAVRLRLPAYLGYRDEQRIEVRAGSVNLLRGAEASFAARASRPLAAAEMDAQPQPVDGPALTTAFQPVVQDAAHRITWRDTDGLTPRDALTLRVRAVDDEAPRIVAKRDSLEQVVLDSEVVTFDVETTDDYGIRQIGVEWTGAAPLREGEPPVHGERVAAAGAPEKRALHAGATFCATRDGVAPQTVEVRAWADDYLPGRPHARSAAFVLHILNKTDHAMWLTQQFGKWLEVARESYEREQQLHETNKELRVLSPADLDRPENRRRVAQQATAENANAARLDGLNQIGRRLVEQAAKNDEFDATRLESWATMLQSLKDIAARRMPSVADLLKQGAGAPTGKLAGPATAPPNATGPAGAGPATPPGAPPNPQPGQAQNSSTGAPSVQHGKNLPPPPGAGSPTAPGTAPKPPVPSIVDRESGFGKPPPPPPADPHAAPKPSGGGKLGLPNTTLGAVADQKKDGDAPPPPESPAQQKMADAVAEQRDLLSEFAKVSDQLNDILGSLEASTFVKRLKAASRQQLAIAKNLNQKTLDAFGIARAPLPAAAPIAEQAQKQSETVRVVQSDLDAYYQRKQDNRFKNVLDQMKKTGIVRALAGDAEKVSANLSGQGIVGSEFWADTLDRWAEEMVSASQCKSSSSGSADSLPPEIVLKVMQALHDEMALRDETRETENTKPVLAPLAFSDRANGLGEKQSGIGAHTQGALDDIRALPRGEERFAKEVRLLTEVAGVMNEARGLLVSPETGGPAVAAESEAIELLLQTKRQGKNGGGGGGSSPGGGGRADTAGSAALADLGPGANPEGLVAMRPVGQATGRAGKEFPAEFKSGLDTYFNLLEGQSSRQ